VGGGGRGFKKFHDRQPNLRQLKTTTEQTKNSSHTKMLTILYDATMTKVKRFVNLFLMPHPLLCGDDKLRRGIPKLNLHSSRFGLVKAWAIR
jgi:hypothetical protein